MAALHFLIMKTGPDVVRRTVGYGFDDTIFEFGETIDPGIDAVKYFSEIHFLRVIKPA
jgi:hypothetical protein